jgi:hypothetical protein
MKYRVTAYVDTFGDLVCGGCNETLRLPTRDERRESLEDLREGVGTGLIAAYVAERTLRRRCNCKGRPWSRR